MKKNLPDLAQTRALHRQGNLELAKKNYLRILKKKPHDVEVLHALGILYAQQEQFEDAIRTLKTANQLQPSHSMISLHLANLLKMQKSFAEATILLNTILPSDANYTAALNNLGTLAYSQGEIDNAIRYYRSAIQREPEYVDAYYNLGLALNKQDKQEEAAHIYQKILALDPNHFAAHFHLASSFMKCNKTQAALTIFLNISTVHPNHFETQTNLATCYLKLGALQEAKQHYIYALDLMPKDTQVLFNLGVISMQLGALDSAIQYYQRALQINPDLFEVHNNLAVAFIAKQEPHLALQHFKEALHLDPKQEAIRHIIQVLSKNQRLLSSPPEYIKTLFDSYANHYELHLINALHYEVPQLLYTATLPLLTNHSSLTILDLGCGTGLVGALFKPLAKLLIGVDLSANMLNVALQKNIYDELITGDMLHTLKNTQYQFDLILAGDVLVYVGDLTEIFAAVYNALTEEGLFVFNTEISDDDEFKMNPSGRFQHHKNYLDDLAKRLHFKIVYYENKITRTQFNAPLYGHLYVLKK